MDAAADLTGRVQARDGVAVGIQHLGLGVDLQAAHGVMQGRGARGGAEGRLVNRVAEELLAEVRIVLGQGVLVVLVHGLHERVSRHADLLRQLLEGVRQVDAAGGLQRLQTVGILIDDLLVGDDEEQRVLLLQGRLGQHVTLGVLVHKALALLVHEQLGLRGAPHAGEQGAIHRMGGRHQLRKAHAGHVGADGLGHHDAVAGQVRRVGGRHGVGQARPVVVVLADHRRVGREAAGRDDDGLVGVQGHGRLTILGDHAADLAVSHGQLFAGGVQQDFHAVFAGSLLQGRDDVAGGQAVGARPHGAQDGGDGVFPAAADGLQPLEAVQRVVREHIDQRQIRGDHGAVQAGAGAAHVAVQHVQLRAVKQGGLAGSQVLLDLALHGDQRVAEVAKVRRIEVQVALQGLQQGAVHLHLVLTLRVSRVEALTGDQGVAAQRAGLLDQHDAGAVLRGGDGRRQARAAAANDDNVIGRLDVLNGRRLHRGRLQRVHIAAGQRNGLSRSSQDGVGGVGRAGHGVNRQGLVLNDRRRNVGNRRIGQARGLRMLGDLHRGDRVGGHGHADLHRAVVAVRLSGIGACRVACRRREADRKGQREAERQSEQHLHLLHVFSLLFPLSSFSQTFLR